MNKYIFIDGAVKRSVYCVHDETHTHLCDVVHDGDLELQIHKTLIGIWDLIVQHELTEQTDTQESCDNDDDEGIVCPVIYECEQRDAFTRSDPLSQNSNTPNTPHSNFTVP